MTRKHILIDLDDTLIDNAAGFKAEREALWRFIADLTDRTTEEVLEHFEHPSRPEGYGRARTVGAAIHAYWQLCEQPSLDDLIAVSERASALFDAPRAPYPGVIEALQRLRRLGARLSVVTMGDPVPQTAKVVRAGLHPFFERIFVQNMKNEASLREVLRELDAERFLYIGNSPANDILPALAAGGDVIWVAKVAWPSEEADMSEALRNPRLRKTESFAQALPWMEEWLNA